MITNHELFPSSIRDISINATNFPSSTHTSPTSPLFRIIRPINQIIKHLSHNTRLHHIILACLLHPSSHPHPLRNSTYLLSLITNALRKLRTPNTLTLIRTNLFLTPQFRSMAWCMMIRSSRSTIRCLDIAHTLCLSREEVTEEAGCVAFLLVFGWAAV